MTKKILYAEFTVRVFVPEDAVPDTVDEDCPFEDPVDDLKASIESIQWDGLNRDHTGVEIKVEDQF